MVGPSVQNCFKNFPSKMTTINSPLDSKEKMLKIAAYVCFAISFIVGVSGYMFIKSYDISSYNTSMIEASLMQVSHLRYVVAAIFALIASVLFSAAQITSLFTNMTSSALPQPIVGPDSHSKQAIKINRTDFSEKDADACIAALTKHGYSIRSDQPEKWEVVDSSGKVISHDYSLNDLRNFAGQVWHHP